MHRYTLLPCLVLSSMSLLYGCAASTKSTVTAPSQGTSLSSTKLVDSGTGGDRASSSTASDSESAQVAGSKTPNKNPGTKTKGAGKMTFRFEDYQKEEDAKEQLIKMFPLGSDYGPIATTLKSIKRIKCSESSGDPLTYTLDCEYQIPTSIATSDSWSVYVYESKNKITKIDVYKHLAAL
jgi:hypothetical protein